MQWEHTRQRRNGSVPYRRGGARVPADVRGEGEVEDTAVLGNVADGDAVGAVQTGDLLAQGDVAGAGVLGVVAGHDGPLLGGTDGLLEGGTCDGLRCGGAGLGGEGGDAAVRADGGAEVGDRDGRHLGQVLAARGGEAGEQATPNYYRRGAEGEEER